jgi:ABC-type nitrate/sulfonate/bicarbonate transport system substrate-binding protein
VSNATGPLGPIDRRGFMRVMGAAGSALGLSAAVAACGSSSSNSSASGGGGGSGGGWSSITELSAESGPDFIGAPIYIAQALDYFRDEGLTVTTQYPGSTPKTVQLMLVGRGQVALPDPAAIISAASRGQRIKSLWTYGKGSFFGFAVIDRSPIQQWDRASIDGATIGISDASGGEVPLLRGALSMIGLAEGDGVTLQPVGGGTAEAADALESGKVDVVAGSYPDFYSLQARGVRLRLITPTEIEQFPRNSVAVKASDYDEHREDLTGYTRALTKAMVFMRANPRATAQLVKRYAPENTDGIDVPTIATVLLGRLLIPGLDSYFDRGSPDFHKVGMQDSAGWDTYMRFLVEGGVESDGIKLNREVPVNEIVDNGLIDAANDFDYAEIEREAKAYRAT